MRAFVFLLLCWCAFLSFTHADHVVVSGGPALRKWEDYRVEDSQHDRWWANFIRGATMRMDEIRRAYGPGARLVWLVYQPGYASRGREDRKPYTQWIAEQASKREATLIWFQTGPGFIQAINQRPRDSIRTFDYFGHSNKYSFMFDYGNEVMASSAAWLHEEDIAKIKGSIFEKNAYCKSWGCHTAESMSRAWREKLGVSLEGARGPTDYTVLSLGQLPRVKGRWERE
jgi:hypothetical protein